MQGITFGPPYFETELGRVEPDSEVHFALLLIVSASDPLAGVPRDELAETLWPESPIELGRHSLRQAMYRLRQLGVPIHLRGGQVILEEDDTEIDLRDLTHGTVPRDELLRIATQPFLAGYGTRLGGRYTAWVQDLRDRTDRVRRRALAEAVREARAQARFRDIHKLARALLALDPLNETATLALAEALVMDGSKVEALQMLDEYEQEVGRISEALRVPVRTLRRRVSECLDDALLPRKFEVPFVGREAEFRELRETFVATRQGKGQCVVITGEPGIGKTRIASELLRLAVLDGAMAVTYSCTSGDALTPLSSLLTLTQSLLGQPGALGCASEHLQYLRRLHSPDPAPSSIAGGMAADIAYAQLVYSLAELTAAIADEGPLVVFVDDAHRLHQTSWRIFTDVVDRVPEKRVLLVFAARQLPEWYATLGINGSDGRSRHVRLAPFGERESWSFLDLWSDKNGVVLADAALSAFSEAAEGNPFYLSELAGHVGRGGSTKEAPATIRTLVELQYASMSKPAQCLLIAIGMLQAHASLDRLVSVLDLSPMDFLRTLDELEMAGVVAATGPQVRVKHDLVMDIVFGLASPGVIGFLRSRVAQQLELDAEATQSTELWGDAMTHWQLANNSQRAHACGLRVGYRLLRMGMGPEAAAAFAAASRYADSHVDKAATHVGYVRALQLSHRWHDVVEECTAHAQLLEYAEVSERNAMLLARAEAELWTLGSVRLLGELQSLIADTDCDLRDRLRAAALALVIADNCLDASAFLEKNVSTIDRILRSAGDDDVNAHGFRLIAAVCTRNPDAKDYAVEYRRIAERLPAGERVRALRLVGNAFARVGDLANAKAAFVDALHLALALSLQHHAVSCLDYLLRIGLQEGDRATAEALLCQLRQLVQATGWGMPFLANAEVAFAWLVRDVANAQELRQYCASPPQDGILAWDVERLDLRMVLAFALPDLIEDDTVSQWLSQPFEARNRGCQDVWIFACAETLVNVGRSSDALDLLQNYLGRLRLEREPPCRLLVERLPPLLARHVDALVSSGERPLLSPRRIVP
jgi:DNA-binding SARP family transcriptional activator